MKKTLLLILSLLMLIGCTAPASAPVVSASPQPDAQFVVLETPSPTPVPTEEPTPEPTPTPAPFALCALPEGMRPRQGYAVTGLAGLLFETATQTYAAYGAFGEDEPAFYPCDETGAVAQDAEPIARVMMTHDYAPTDVPKKDGARQLVVYLGSQSVVAFVAQDGEWVQERVMICSTGRAKHETPTGHFKIYQRYDYKILGTGDSHCYGFYACRFKGHYLFHSVPISFDAGRSQKKGHRMCDMHKFEKLGTVASDGCVRVCVGDAKWIYDISENDTVTVWVTKASGPIAEKPPAVIWEEPYTDRNGFGWDPTDPDPENPYLQDTAADS